MAVEQVQQLSIEERRSRLDADRLRLWAEYRQQLEDERLRLWSEYRQKEIPLNEEERRLREEEAAEKQVCPTCGSPRSRE